jgi:hypothetical protein
MERCNHVVAEGEGRQERREFGGKKGLQEGEQASIWVMASD